MRRAYRYLGLQEICIDIPCSTLAIAVPQVLSQLRLSSLSRLQLPPLEVSLLTMMAVVVVELGQHDAGAR